MKSWSLYRWGLSVLSACMLSVMCAAVSVRAGAVDKEEPPETIESAEASTMQLMKTEGDVEVSNASGRDISIINNMKLYNGYCTNTQEASYAWINLDSEKLTKLDAVSEAEIRKSGKKLEILLKAGNLFFDVTEPLEEEETLNIRTSTMVMGIRGTCGWVKVIDQWRSQVYILEGMVVCYVTDPVTGQIKSTALSAGEMAEFVVYEEGRAGEYCDIIRQGFTEQDIDGFVLTELAGDSTLCKRIADASDLKAEAAAEGASERLSADQAGMKETLDAIRKRYESQENHISRDPVWVKEEDGGELSKEAAGASSGSRPAISGGIPPQDGGSPSGTSGGSNSSGNGNSNPPANPENPVNQTPPTVLTAGTDDITPESIQNLLDDPNVSEVVVRPNPDDAADPDNTIVISQPAPDQPAGPGEKVVIPDGKTLTLDGVDMENNGIVQVDGTLNVNGELENNGTIIVNGS